MGDMTESDKNKTQGVDLKQYLSALLEEDEETAGGGMSIDWKSIYSKIRARWIFMTVLILLFGILGVAFALSRPKQYSVSVLLAPELRSTSSSGSSLSSIASALGVGNMNLGSSSDALNVTLLPNVVTSTTFLSGLLDISVNPVLAESDSAQLLRNYMEDLHPAPFWKFLKSEPKEEPSRQLLVRNFSEKEQGLLSSLAQCITVEVDTKTAEITLEVTFQDPQVATQLADTVCQRMQEYVINYRTGKAQADLKYYTRLAQEARDKLIKAQQAYAHCVDYDRSVILQSVNSERERLQTEVQLASQIYAQMETQKEAARAKCQELKPVFTVIQPAVFPLQPSSTSRKTVVLAFLMIGFCISLAWVLFLSEYLEKIRSFLKNA